MRWPNLSAHGLKLLVITLPDNSRKLILHGNVEPYRQAAIEQLGFRESVTKKLMRDELKFNLADFRRVFPNITVSEMEASDIFKMASAKANPSEVRNEVELRTAKPLGLNYLGQEVFEGVAGRFVRGGNAANVLREADTPSPAAFLRAVDEKSMALCADGFVLEVMNGKICRADDLKRFAATIYGEPIAIDDMRLRTAQEAIEAALNRKLSREIEVPNEHAFGVALKLHEGQPPMIYRTSNSVENQQYSTPMPMSIVAQRLLGDVTGKTVLEPTIGNASLVSGLDAETIYGLDIDRSRVAQASMIAGHKNAIIGWADAVSSDLKLAAHHAAGGAGEVPEFDFTIGNPPFGGLKQPVMIEKLRATRIDHLILMRSLLARKPEGRSVYIIGADSGNYIDGKEGRVHGGSRNLFNWLEDHYQIEDVVELDGALYGRQGAGYPVRMLVIGNRLQDGEVNPNNIPDQLPTIRDYESLWKWSDHLLQKRAQEAEAKAGSDSWATRPRSEYVAEVERLLNEKYGIGVADTNEDAISNAHQEGWAPAKWVAYWAEHHDLVPFDEREINLPPKDETAIINPTAAAENPHEENSYQAPYIPLSHATEPMAMTPRNMVGATRSALSRFHEKFGDIDEWVKRKLGYEEHEDIGDYLSAEQIDAVALAIDDYESGKGFILGDQTGLGKGRVVAALARYAKVHDLPVVFVTEKAALFTDFWRDLEDINATKLFKPVVLNDGVSIEDQKGKKAVLPTPKAEVQRMISSQMTLEETGYDLMFSTYSQFNRDPNKSPKSAWLPDVCKGAFMIMDESHNAAGDSNIGRNFATAMEYAAGTIYSSATFARGAKNMSIYSKVFPKSMGIDDLADTLAAGGEPLQEVLSAMLAEDGVFIRREHDLSALEFITDTDSERLAAHEALSDKLSDILVHMSYISGDIGKLVGKKNKEIKTYVAGLPESARKGNRMGVSNVNFGSRLYNITRQFMMAIKIDKTVEDCINALNEGRKPVVVVENTMETLLKETLLNREIDDEEEEEGSKKVPEKIEQMVIEPVTFRDLLYKVLDRIQNVQERSRYGEVSTVRMTSLAETPEQAEAMDEAIKHLKGLIAKFPDLPLSPLDTIRHKLKEAGFRCAEVSGRALGVEVLEDGQHAIVPLDNQDRVKTIRKFNNGELDAVILSVAGSTGISLHSSEKFQDQRQRELVELQIANNVLTRMQFFGRVNRKGQVNSPIIRTLSSGLPGEVRLLAMQNQKLRKLSANTTSNRENAAESREIPDIINWLGNKVCFRFLENNPDIATMLDIDLDKEQDTSTDDAYFANKLTGRIVMLPIAEQRRVYEEITQEYHSMIREMEAAGQNPFKLQEHDWKARIVDRQIFEGAEKDHYDSVFEKPVYATTIEFDRMLKPMRSDRVIEMVNDSVQELMSDGRVEAPKTQYASLFDKMLEIAAKKIREVQEASLGDKFETIEQALTDSEPNPVKNMQNRLAFLQKALKFDIAPGRFIEFKINGEKQVGVITGIKLPENRREHLLGQYQISVVAPGDNRTTELTLNMLYQEGYTGTYAYGSLFNPNNPNAPATEMAKKVFDNAPEGKITIRRTVLDGNLFRAAQMAAKNRHGHSVVYTDAEGVRQRAVLLKKDVTVKDLMAIPVKLPNAELATKLMLHELRTNGNEIYLVSDSNLDRSKGFIIQVENANEVMITTPGSKAVGGLIYLDPDIRELTGDFAGNRTFMRATFDIAKLPEVMAAIYRKNVSFHAKPDYRELLNAWEAGEEELKANAELAA